MSRNSKVEKSSGNVFADLGLPNAERHLVKAQLVYELSSIIKRRKLSIRQAAKLLNLDHSNLAKILRGDFRRYSVERLMGFLTFFDRDIEIRVKRKRKTGTPGQVFVTGA